MTDKSPPSSLTACPECGATGRKVGLMTLEALLSEEARGCLGNTENYRFCKTGTCDVAYFGDGTFQRADVRVPIFHKSTEPSRLVCYCFEHKVNEIEDEVWRTGSSSVPDAIEQKCRDGLDHCEEMNPQGSCCLGNARQVMKRAQAASVSGRDL